MCEQVLDQEEFKIFSFELWANFLPKKVAWCLLEAINVSIIWPILGSKIFYCVPMNKLILNRKNRSFGENIQSLMELIDSAVELVSLYSVVDSCIKFPLVHLLLIISPFALTVSFLLSQTSVLFLHRFHHSGFLFAGVVFKHTSHPCNGVSLTSVVIGFGMIILNLLLVFTCLLLNPSFLLLCLDCNSLMI